MKESDFVIMSIQILTDKELNLRAEDGLAKRAALFTYLLSYIFGISPFSSEGKRILGKVFNRLERHDNREQ